VGEAVVAGVATTPVLTYVCVYMLYTYI